MKDPSAHMISGGSQLQFAPSVQAYLAAITRICAEGEYAIASVILFGSVAASDFRGSVSDVDLILVLHDDASPENRRRLSNHVMALEILHGLRKAPSRKGVLEVAFDRISASDSSFFVCMRADLLSGLPSRILNLHAAQAFFVDRIVIPGILSSAVTFWGEELLTEVAVKPIRRLDVFKAFFGFFVRPQ
jgi:predicted nucleotidyltransferase